MNEFVDVVKDLSPLVAGAVTGILLPLLGARRDPRDPSAVRSMSRHAKLHDALPEGSRGPIRLLLSFEAEKYARALMRKGKRKLHAGNLAAVIFVAVLTGFIEYALVAIAFVWWPALLLAGGVFGFSAALLSVGFRQMYVYEEDDPLAAPIPGAVKPPGDADEMPDTGSASAGKGT